VTGSSSSGAEDSTPNPRVLLGFALFFSHADESSPLIIATSEGRSRAGKGRERSPAGFRRQARLQASSPASLELIQQNKRLGPHPEGRTDPSFFRLARFLHPYNIYAARKVSQALGLCLARFLQDGRGGMCRIMWDTALPYLTLSYTSQFGTIIAGGARLIPDGLARIFPALFPLPGSKPCLS